jgi:tRNA-uridine 2-sulfurtransferase
MTAHALANHMERPTGRGHTPSNAHTGAAGGAACGDLIRVSLAVDPSDPGGMIIDAGFDASGCGAVIAAGSALTERLGGIPLLDAARIGAAEIADDLGGLSVAKRHAAELAADALHRALGAAVRGSAMLAASPGRALVAMSGGVDSAVAAVITMEDGAETVGVTLELWSDPENDGEQSCCSAQAVRGARELAHRLGMAHISIDLREEFRAGVVDPWLTDHAAGLTPNPCVRCNGNVRLDAMLDLADRLGAQTLITGHYARVHREPVDASPLLRTAADPSKDQSYVLASLSPASLERIRFPLGAMHKTEVRELARHAGLPVADKRDSQDLCFLAGTKHASFLERHGAIKPRPGRVVDHDGRLLGEHSGQHAFTVGQRRGLQLGGGEPMYVLGTDAQTNTVTVGPRERLLSQTIGVERVTLHRNGANIDAVKIRSRGRRLPCQLPRDVADGSHERLTVRLLEPLERTAPGQLACLYEGDLIVGYGTISE